MIARTIIEPFRIKSVEPLKLTTREEREKAIGGLRLPVPGEIRVDTATSRAQSPGRLLRGVKPEQEP